MNASLRGALWLLGGLLSALGTALLVLDALGPSAAAGACLAWLGAWALYTAHAR